MTKRSERRTLSRKREEQLSAYVDNQLSASERARLEAQLAADPALRGELAALRKTVVLMREIPAVPVPRNFILPRTAALRPRVAVPARPRLAWAAPFLTAATGVVSLLFVVALAGNLLVASTRGSLGAPADAYEAVEAPAAEALATVLVEAEIELPVEKEVVALTEAPAPLAEAGDEPEAAAEEALPEEEAAPVEVGEEAVAPAPTEAAIADEDALAEGAAPQEEPPAPAEPPALEAAEEGEEAADDGVSRDATFESRVATAERLLGTAAAEKAAGPEEAETPQPAGGGGEATPTPAPTLTRLVESPEPEPTEGAGAPLAEDAGIPSTGQASEPPLAARVDEELTPPPSERLQARERPSSFSGFPWLAFQIALGSSAIVLLVVTVWAWRMRR